MKSIQKSTAFSLIEISIVILIIGILTAGVTQSSRLIRAAKMSSARSMTQSSPASSIRNLALWIESTSEQSFRVNNLSPTAPNDGEAVTVWNDINPQTTSKITFTSGGSPKYEEDLINGLPAVCFNNANCGNGTTDHFTTTGFSDLTSGITIFAVIRTPNSLDTSSTINEPILSKRNNVAAYNTLGSANFQLNLTTNGSWQFCDGRVQSTNNTTCVFLDSNSLAPASARSNYVVSVVYNSNSNAVNNSTSGGITFFQNGFPGDNSGTSANQTFGSSPGTTTSPLLIGRVSTNNTIAMDRYFKGYVGEIIIFDRALRREERQSIEEYLGKKWGIAMVRANF